LNIFIDNFELFENYLAIPHQSDYDMVTYSEHLIHQDFKSFLAIKVRNIYLTP